MKAALNNPLPNRKEVADYDHTHGLEGYGVPWYFIIPLEEMGLSVRLFNRLRHDWNVQTIGDLRHMSIELLYKTRNFGPICEKELLCFIEDQGLLLFDHLRNPVTVQTQLEKGNAYWSGQTHLKDKYGSILLHQNYIANKVDTVKNTQGGCVIEPINLNDPLWRYKLAEFEKSGIQVMTYAVLSMPAATSNPDNIPG